MGREWALLAGRDLLVAVFSREWEEIKRLNCGKRFGYYSEDPTRLLRKLSACFSLADLRPQTPHLSHFFARNGHSVNTGLMGR